MIEIKNSSDVWVELPTPQSLEFGLQDITDSNRTVDGTMHIEQIARKQKLNCTWGYLTRQELQNLLNLIDEKTFYLRFENPETMEEVEKEFYKGNRTFSIHRFINGVPDYKEIKINFIEV
ncbi:MAG: DUF6711 family protein [archaeon]